MGSAISICFRWRGKFDGRVSRSFDEWRLVERDIRAYLRLGLQISRHFYEATWKEVSERPSDGEGPGLPDVFEHEVEGLYSNDFEWMLFSSVLKDGVTAFEVYLEKAADEVLRWQKERRLPRSRGQDSPRWSTLIAFYRRVGVSFSDDIDSIRRLRHLLTHQRGELRTEGHVLCGEAKSICFRIERSG